MCGLIPWHVRLLVDDPWEGGRGHSLQDVSSMTLDQVFFLLCDRKKMKQRRNLVAPMAVKVDEDGYIKGRAVDGTPIRGRVGGKSVARRLMEAAAERKKTDKSKTRRRK